VLPDLYKDREAMLEEVAELQKRTAMLRMYGPRSREDLELYYFIITGQIRVPKGAIWDWENWYEPQDFRLGFQTGIFSMRRYIQSRKPGKLLERYDVAAPGNQSRWPSANLKYTAQIPDALGDKPPAGGFAGFGIPYPTAIPLRSR
jgi:hypothetical protein